jgi:hypothetical protein
MSDRRHKLQSWLLLGVMTLGFGLGLGGCGKQARQVDPPPDVTDDNFPRPYPNPALDPKP